MEPQLVFVDGSFADLAQDMANYLGVGEDVKPLLSQESSYDEALKKLVMASTALQGVPEKEFTGASNMLVYLVLQSKNANMFLSRLCDNLAKPLASSPQNGAGLALGALTNLFNMVKPENEVRYHVFSAIVRFVRAHGMFEGLKRYLPKLDGWMEQWGLNDEETRRLYELIAETASEAGDEEESYNFILKAIRIFDEDSSAEAQRLSLRAIRTALLSPSHFDFQDLLCLPAVSSLSESHPVYFELLKLFAEKDVEDYVDFNEEHPDFLEKETLNPDKLHRKMRLLTFASLAASSTGTREIPYGAIAKHLQIPESDIEMWTIDVVRAGLVEGKLSQKQKVFLVHRTTYRVFNEKQWRELDDRIDTWRNTLRAVAAALRREQANAEASRRRDTEEMERKVAGIGFGGGGGGGGGGGRRGGGGKPQRNDNDN